MAKILIVDDERVLVKGIKFNLEHEGYQVQDAYDGEEAVELAREGGFDLIILDVMMPKIDGLRSAGPGLPSSSEAAMSWPQATLSSTRGSARPAGTGSPWS